MGLIEEQGVKQEEMYKTFNMGIGFCLISPQNEVKKIRKIFKKHRITTYEIGYISKKKGVFVNSKNRINSLNLNQNGRVLDCKKLCQ